MSGHGVSFNWPGYGPKRPHFDVKLLRFNSASAGCAAHRSARFAGHSMHRVDSPVCVAVTHIPANAAQRLPGLSEIRPSPST
jgi:hypothetical protein